jgi:hypothetical protein
VDPNPKESVSFAGSEFEKSSDSVPGTDSDPDTVFKFKKILWKIAVQTSVTFFCVKGSRTHM